MKTQLFQIVFLLSVFTTSCSSGPNDYSKGKKISIKEANSELYSIQEDIKVKKNTLTLEEKITCSLVEYSQKEPSKYKDLLENPPRNVRKVLLEDKSFTDVCRGMELDPEAIPIDYFDNSNK